MDRVLVDKVTEIWARVPRKHVMPADILAVVEHESHNAVVFRATDKQYRDNLAAAKRITGLDEDVINKAMTIAAGPYKGQISKFRCEPGYWLWAKDLPGFTPSEKLLLSCSFGLGQKMSRWLVNKLPKPEWIPFVQNFMGNVSLQLLYVTGDLDTLMRETNGDKPLAFTRYNAGPKATDKNPAYTKYGLPVSKRSQEIQQCISEERKHGTTDSTSVG